MKLICRLRPQPNNTSQSSINSRKDVRCNIFAASLSNETPQTIVVSSRNAISQKIISEYLRSDSDIMKQRQSIIENADLFQFDQVFGEKANQQLLYDQILSPRVNALVTGNSATLLILGGPDSGKKHTLKGEDRDKGLAILAAENILNLIEGSKQLKGKGKLLCSISLVNNSEVIDIVGSSRSPTVKFTQVKNASEFKKMLNQSLFQYKQYVKEHPQQTSNHVFLKFLIQQDKQEVAQLNFILFNEFRKLSQEAKDFQGKLNQLLQLQSEFQERDLETKSLQQLYLSLRETKFSNIAVLFCVSQIQSNYATACMTLHFAEELRQAVRPQTQRMALSQIENRSVISRVQQPSVLQQQQGSLLQQQPSLLQQQPGSLLQQQQGSLLQQPSQQIKGSMDDRTEQVVSRIMRPGSDQTLQQSTIERQPSRQEQNFSRQFQELKDLLKEKEVVEDYKVQRIEKELKGVYDDNARLQQKVYNLEDSVKQRDQLIAQMQQHIDDNKRQIDMEHQILSQAQQKENMYERNQEELNEAVQQLSQQLHYSNEEGQIQKQRIKMLENDLELLKEQEFSNVKHYEKREDEFMALIQQEQERNKQLYQELDYFAVELKNKEQQLLSAEDNIRTLNKVIEEQCKRVDEEKQKSKELNENLNSQKQKLEEAIRDINQVEQRFTKLRVKLETENNHLKTDKEKYLQKYKDKLKKYKTALKTAESENAQMKMDRVKLQTENDQLYGISKQLETQLGRVHSESTERMGGNYDNYEQDKFRQVNLQLNSQLKQADFEIQQLSQQLNNAISQLERTSMEYEKLLQENQRLSKLWEDKQNEAKQSEFMIEKMVELSDKQLDDLENKFNKVTAQVNTLQHEKKSLQAENQALKQQLEQMDGNDLVLEKRIVKLRKENKDLSNQIKQLNQNMKEMIVEKHSELRNNQLNQSRYSQKLLNQSYRSRQIEDDDDDEEDL